MRKQKPALDEKKLLQDTIRGSHVYPRVDVGLMLCEFSLLVDCGFINVDMTSSSLLSSSLIFFNKCCSFWFSIGGFSAVFWMKIFLPSSDIEDSEIDENDKVLKVENYHHREEREPIKGEITLNLFLGPIQTSWHISKLRKNWVDDSGKWSSKSFSPAYLNSLNLTIPNVKRNKGNKIIFKKKQVFPSEKLLWNLSIFILTSSL